MEHKETENSGLEIDKTIIETTGKVEAFYEQNKKNMNRDLTKIYLRYIYSFVNNNL